MFFSNVDYNVVVYFFGGFDDREVLVYGFCMVEYLGVKFYVICFFFYSVVMDDGYGGLVFVGLEVFEIGKMEVSDICF